MEDKVGTCISILGKLKPAEHERDARALIQASGVVEEDLLQSITLPLTVKEEPTNGKSYLLCHAPSSFEKGSYRSPWTNIYDPPTREGAVPSEGLRQLELEANELLESYCALYYDGEGAIGSAYFWDKEGGFGACFLLKKHCEAGSWDAVHTVAVTGGPGGGGGDGPASAAAAAGGRPYVYRMASRARLVLAPAGAGAGAARVSAALARQSELEGAVDGLETHMTHLGALLEAAEGRLMADLSGHALSRVGRLVDEARPGGLPDPGGRAPRRAFKLPPGAVLMPGMGAPPRGGPPPPPPPGPGHAAGEIRIGEEPPPTTKEDDTGVGASVPPRGHVALLAEAIAKRAAASQGTEKMFYNS